jgi:hypothetical protein
VLALEPEPKCRRASCLVYPRAVMAIARMCIAICLMRIMPMHVRPLYVCNGVSIAQLNTPPRDRVCFAPHAAHIKTKGPAGVTMHDLDLA